MMCDKYDCNKTKDVELNFLGFCVWCRRLSHMYSRSQGWWDRMTTAIMRSTGQLWGWHSAQLCLPASCFRLASPFLFYMLPESLTQNDSSPFSFQKLRVCCPHGCLLWGHRDIWSSRVPWLCPCLGDGLLRKKPQKTKATSTPAFYLSVNKKQVDVFWIMISESRISVHTEGSPSCSVVKNLLGSTDDTGDMGFDSWMGQTPWERKWQPTPVFLPGKAHGQKNLTSYSPWGHKE